MTAGTNAYCEHLGIAVPSLAAARQQRDASTYTLLLVALLEHGAPMTLAEVASRFDAAGIAPADAAHASLKRCRPARPPVYRDGDRYALDPHDAELDLWAFRLGLRPPKVARPAPSPPPVRPPCEQRLSVAELDTAWRNASLDGWSAQRLALAVLDAHDGPMQPEDVVSFVSARTKWHRLTAGPTTFRRTGAAVAVAPDGTWSIVPGAPELGMARDAVRDAVERAHRRPPRSSPDEWAESSRAYERRRAAHAAELAALRRVIVHAFPVKAPRAAVLVDVDRRTLTTLVDDQLATVAELLEPYDVVSGVDIRATLRALGVDSEHRRLAELGPPQKSVTLDRPGRALKITTAMLVQGSCGISRPLADPKQLRAHLADKKLPQLLRRLEADAKALYALHQYGKLHGCVRLRWGGLDEVFPAPWHHQDESTLYHLKQEARALAMGLLAVVGSAPGWDEDPWSGARRLAVEPGERAHDLLLFDEEGRYVDDRDVQLARLEVEVH
ncbi:MAG: hypothetical protein M3680_27375 [Myxococcota bacterium]|nr:hypothetical protein [Myxococcota bacterium]